MKFYIIAILMLIALGAATLLRTEITIPDEPQPRIVLPFPAKYEGMEIVCIDKLSIVKIVGYSRKLRWIAMGKEK